jgi:hypothetical protein
MLCFDALARPDSRPCVFESSRRKNVKQGYVEQTHCNNTHPLARPDRQPIRLILDSNDFNEDVNRLAGGKGAAEHHRTFISTLLATKTFSFHPQPLETNANTRLHFGRSSKQHFSRQI